MSLNLCKGQNFFPSVSLTSGWLHNTEIIYEKGSDKTIENERHNSRMYTYNHNNNPYFKLGTTIFKDTIKHQKKDRSLLIAFTGGFYTYKIERDYSFLWYTMHRPHNSEIIISGYPELIYWSTTNHVAFDFGVQFTKVWGARFMFEYGLSYRLDQAFNQKVEVTQTPHTGQWETVSYSSKEVLKNNFKDNFYLLLQPSFKITHRLYLGLPIEAPLPLTFWKKFQQNYPLLMGSNNFMNRNFFVGVEVKYLLN